MIYTIRKEIEINAGETWRNDMNYTLKVLAVGNTELWCEWENGHIGAFEVDKFVASKYEKVP